MGQLFLLLSLVCWFASTGWGVSFSCWFLFVLFFWEGGGRWPISCFGSPWRGRSRGPWAWRRRSWPSSFWLRWCPRAGRRRGRRSCAPSKWRTWRWPAGPRPSRRRAPARSSPSRPRQPKENSVNKDETADHRQRHLLRRFSEIGPHPRIDPKSILFFSSYWKLLKKCWKYIMLC